MTLTILVGDCVASMRTLDAGSVHCAVTSPPYWGLRDYGHEGQIGLERTPDAYVARMVEVFREVRRVLRDDGTLWLNLGDTIVAKQLQGIPWRVAFALQADGWYLRSEIIWHKPNPMPESVRDRPTKAHEQVFLLAKSERYYYDADAVREPLGKVSLRRIEMASSGAPRAVGRCKRAPTRRDAESGISASGPGTAAAIGAALNASGRNRRSVWSIATRSYRGAHFAVFPPKLAEPCILAGCPVGGTVLDPFAGSGTTAEVSLRLGRKAVALELNPEYARLIEERTRAQMPLGGVA